MKIFITGVLTQIPGVYFNWLIVLGPNLVDDYDQLTVLAVSLITSIDS